MVVILFRSKCAKLGAEKCIFLAIKSFMCHSSISYFPTTNVSTDPMSCAILVQILLLGYYLSYQITMATTHFLGGEVGEAYCISTHILFYWHSLLHIRPCIRNGWPSFLWDVITHPCPKVNGCCSAKPILKLEQLERLRSEIPPAATWLPILGITSDPK